MAFNAIQDMVNAQFGVLNSTNVILNEEIEGDVNVDKFSKPFHWHESNGFVEKLDEVGTYRCACKKTVRCRSGTVSCIVGKRQKRYTIV